MGGVKESALAKALTRISPRGLISRRRAACHEICLCRQAALPTDGEAGRTAKIRKATAVRPSAKAATATTKRSTKTLRAGRSQVGNRRRRLTATVFQGNCVKMKGSVSKRDSITQKRNSSGQSYTSSYPP